MIWRAFRARSPAVMRLISSITPSRRRITRLSHQLKRKIVMPEARDAATKTFHARARVMPGTAVRKSAKSRRQATMRTHIC